MITILLIVIALAAIMLVLQAGARNAALARMEVQQDKAAHSDIPTEVVALAKAGRRVEALRAYREATGCSTEIAMARVGPLFPPEQHRHLGLILVAGALAMVALVVLILFRG